MSSTPNPYYSSFINVSRDINLVMLKGGDVVAFVDEVFPVDPARPGLQCHGYQGGPQTWTESLGGINSTASCRGLVYYRMSGGDVVQGPRPVYYSRGQNYKGTGMDYNQNAESGYYYGLSMFTEIFNPKVIYDADSNTLHLWFWANWNTQFTISPIYYGYSQSQGYTQGLAPMYPDNLWNFTQGHRMGSRVLFYTTGKFIQTWVKGSYMYGFQSTLQPISTAPVGAQGFQNEGWDLIPIFGNPFIIAATTNYDTLNLPGNVSDGYGMAGCQWPSYFPIQFNGPIVANCPFYNVTAYPNGLSSPGVAAFAEPLALSLYDNPTASSGSYAIGIQTPVRVLGDGI